VSEDEHHHRHHHRAKPVRTAAHAPSESTCADAKTIGLREADAATVQSIIEALPDPESLDVGDLVLLPAELAGGRSFAKSVLRVFGRAKTVPVAFRCSALVARGYVRVGADDDLAWGYAPPRELADD
jgi:hypothetical protein